jgi:formamidopyrimidine-DNA glycosylase
MPELPEVETVVRGLRPVLVGQRILAVKLRSPGLRFPFPSGLAASLEGRRVLGLRRRAKYIIADLEGEERLLLHLGMTGRLTVVAKGGPRILGEFYYPEGEATPGEGRHDHVVIDVESGVRIVYSDPRRFGVLDLYREGEPHRLLRGLGPEPLGNDFNAEALALRFAGRTAPLKAALLDQRVVAGLGNIYVSEALHRAELSPRRKAGSLARGRRLDPRLETLVRHIRAVLAEAIAAGGSTLQEFAHPNGEAGAFQRHFAVYDREGEPCWRCGRPIRRLVQAGRSTFYCTTCQK